MVTLVWVIFVISGLGLVGIVLSKLPKALIKPTGRVRLIVAADNLFEYFWHKIKQLLAWVWHFVLEAKDIRPTPLITNQMDRVKKVFHIRIRESDKEPVWLPEVTDHAVAQTEASEGRNNKTAEELYLETIKKDPDNRQAYEGLGRLYLQEKNFSESAEIFIYLTGRYPNRDVYWSNLGISQYSLKQYKEAVASYEQALKLNSKIPARWINLALCYEAMDEHTKSVKAVNKALELDPRNNNYLMLQADIYVRVNNKVRAEEVLTQVLSTEPTNKLAREKLMKLKI